jgi:hypothetical protein
MDHNMTFRRYQQHRSYLPRLCLAACVACLAAFAGCIPLPHDQRRVPEISGTIYRNGAPWAGASVTLSYRSSDGKEIPDRTITASKEGSFHFDPISEFNFFLTLGDRFDSWRLCFYGQAGIAFCWEERAMWGGPGALPLRCEVKDTDNEAPILTDAERPERTLLQQQGQPLPAHCRLER